MFCKFLKYTVSFTINLEKITGILLVLIGNAFCTHQNQAWLKPEKTGKSDVKQKIAIYYKSIGSV